LAFLLIDLNETKRAIVLWEKAYSIWLSTLGKSHPNTQNVKRALEHYKPKS